MCRLASGSGQRQIFRSYSATPSIGSVTGRVVRLFAAGDRIRHAKAWLRLRDSGNKNLFGSASAGNALSNVVRLSFTESTTSRPRVSIGLTVFNGERYLEEAIRSLLAQTFEDIELIISDNASTDRTKQIALAYVAQDRRVRYLRNRMNIGAAGNFNQVFRLSSGEFFKWAAYDDLCSPDFLQRCVQALDRDPDVVLAYPLTVGIDEHGRTILPPAPGPDLTSPDPAIRFANIMASPFWATSLFGVIRAEVMSRTGLMPSNAAPDHALLAELSLHGRFCEINEEGFLQRDHPGRAFTKSSISRRAQQVDPRLGTNPLLLRLSQIGSYVSAIGRAPLDRSTRLRCYWAVGHWLGSRMMARALDSHDRPRRAIMRMPPGD